MMQTPNIQKYTEYKDSGVEWLGEIPAHWEVKKLKFLGNIYAGLNGKKGDDFSKEYSFGIKSYIPFTNICNNIKISENQFHFVKVDEKENQNRVLKNDILFLMSSETLEDIAKNSIYVGNNKELYLNSFCKGFRISNENIYPEYVNYLFLSSTYRSYFSLVGRGFTRINLKQEFINDAFALIPSYEEQIAIADFLDRKTALIDQAIAIKQKQIELLKERRQILIHKAVTQGLNPNVERKDSGVEWIGEIPQHWEVKRLKHLYTDTFSGGTPSTDILKFWDGEISWISSADVKTNFLDKTLRNITDLGFKRSSSNMARKGSVIIVTRSGILQHTLPIAILMKDMAINQDIKCFILREELISPNYLLNYIQGNNNEILVETRKQGATVESIEMEDFANLTIPLPPIQEQIQILNSIRNISDKISTAISLKSQEIAKLKEYKTTLINSAVTGKIKVG